MSDTIRHLAERLIAQGADDIPTRERRLLEKLANRIAANSDWHAELDERLTFGQRVSDAVAFWGGSWTFIIAFAVVMAAWIGTNLLAASRAFDPYPFILLNLVLSTVAALQAPIIMMSQNRQAMKDRLQATHDYEVNLKAELEIVALHDKLDRLRIDDLHNALARVEDRLKAAGH